MDTQEQLPPNSFQSQISALDGIITSTSINTSLNYHNLSTGGGITYYGQDGQVIAITGGTPTWVNYEQTDWIEVKRTLTPEETRQYYETGVIPGPDIDRGIFGLMKLVANG